MTDYVAAVIEAARSVDLALAAIIQGESRPKNPASIPVRLGLALEAVRASLRVALFELDASADPNPAESLPQSLKAMDCCSGFVTRQGREIHENLEHGIAGSIAEAPQKAQQEERDAS